MDCHELSLPLLLAFEETLDTDFELEFRNFLKDWNLCLDEEGGPNHVRLLVDDAGWAFRHGLAHRAIMQATVLRSGIPVLRL